MRRDAVAARYASAVVVAALTLAGCAARPATTMPAAAAPAAEEWLTDAEGRQYVVRSIPRTAAVRVDAHTARGPLSVPLHLVREDAEHYYYKLYRAPAATAGPPPPPASPRMPTVEPPTGSRLDFVPFGTGLPTAGQWRDGFALADMNGDDRLDVVHGPARKGRPVPAVFLGDGAGSWRRWDEAQFPALPYDYGAAQAGDLNGDGVADLALAVHLRGVLALLGDGRGGFANASRGLDFATNGTAGRFSSRALALADVDGDGRRDIVALADGPRLARPDGQPTQRTGAVVYLNGGEAWRRGAADLAPGLFGNSVVTADFDGDGRPDVASASGAVGRRDVVSFGNPEGAWRATVLPLPDAVRVRAVGAGDVDGDGRADLALAWSAYAADGWQSGLDLLQTAGDGWTRRSLAVVNGLEGPSAVAVGDVDGDRRGDVVALTTRGETWVLVATGRDFVREAGPPAYGPGCRGSSVQLADLDRDGRDEIVAAFALESSPGIGGAACPTGGGLTAWKLVPRAS